MKAMIVGYGSIGRKHYEILRKLGFEITIISERELEGKRYYRDLSLGLKDFDPDYIVVANKTSSHLESLVQIRKLGFEKKVLIEKPLFFKDMKLSDFNTKNIYVGYNLRFHPLIKKLKDELKDQKILSAQVYAGQYLPYWRPEVDYRNSYSSKDEEGGGVLRDLSHELDYTSWLFGKWLGFKSLVSKVSHLEINSCDICGIILKTEKCPLVTIQLNYLDRIKQREIIVNTDEITLKIDLINNIFYKNETKEIIKVDPLESYERMHEAIINDFIDDVCDFDSGLEMVRLIEEIYISAKEEKWISRI